MMVYTCMIIHETLKLHFFEKKKYSWSFHAKKSCKKQFLKVCLLLLCFYLFVCLFVWGFFAIVCSIFLFFMTIFWFVSAMSVNRILTITRLNRNFNLYFVSSSKTWKKLQSLGCHCWVQSTFWIINFFSIYRLLISAAVLFVLILSMFYLDMDGTNNG